MLIECDEEAEIVVEISWTTLALSATVITLFTIAWASGVFHDLILFLPSLQPVELTLSKNSYTPNDTIDLKVCIAEWIKGEELSLIVISPEGTHLYSSRIRTGSDNCMALSIRLNNFTEGIYTVAVVRRNKAIHIVHFKVNG